MSAFGGKKDISVPRSNVRYDPKQTAAFKLKLAAHLLLLSISS